ncbi:MAG: SpoIIE family protein phosphatase [Chloroflexota bacterium]
MINIELLLQQRPDLFDNLAARWHTATEGELILLSNSGQIIKGYNGTHALDSIIQQGQSGEMYVKPAANAIITPMLVHGERKGYLLSCNSLESQLPMLSWAADILLDHLNSEQALQGMTDELIVAWDQLELVYRITQTLGEHSNLSNVLHSTLEEITKVVTVELAFILYGYNGRLNCVLAGEEGVDPAILTNQVLLDSLATFNQLTVFNNREPVLDVWPDAPSNLYNFIGAPIITDGSVVVGLGLINNHKQHLPHDFTAGHGKLITSVCEQIGAIFDYFTLQDDLIAQERLRRELEIAAQIQESLLPGKLPDTPGLKIDVTTLPAYEVGGDFYDFVENDANQITAIIGDVAGKGIPAAMVTSMIRTMLRVEASRNQEPHAIIQQAHQALYEDLSRADLFVTAFVATLDANTNALMYANAGHVPAIIYHSNAKTPRLLKATSLPIGVTHQITDQVTQYVHVSPGDTLVIYSDGVFEATNAEGEQFGIEGIQDLVSQYADSTTPAELKDIILDRLSSFSDSKSRADDLTLAIIKFTPQTVIDQAARKGDTLRTLPFTYKADTIHLDDICTTVTNACRDLRNLVDQTVEDDFIYLVELAMSEIFTNIIEHAYKNIEGNITGSLELMNTGIEINVYDQGEGFNPNAVPPPISNPLDPSEGGYGLHIVRQIMDVAHYEVDTPLGNHWRLIKYLPE